MIKKKSFKLRLFSAFICFLTILNSGGAVSASDVSLGDFNSTCANTTNISLLMALNESEKLVQQAHEEMPQKSFFNLTSEDNNFYAKIVSIGATASFLLAEYVPIMHFPTLPPNMNPALFGQNYHYGSLSNIIFETYVPVFPLFSIPLTTLWLADTAKNFTTTQLTMPGLLTYLGSVALIASARVYDINRLRRHHYTRDFELFSEDRLAPAATAVLEISFMGEWHQTFQALKNSEFYNDIFPNSYQPYGFSSISPLHWGWMAYSAIGVNAVIWGVWGLGQQVFQMVV